MSTEATADRPWEPLLNQLDEGASSVELASYLDALSAADAVLAVSHLANERQVELLGRLEAEDASELLSLLPEVHVAPLLAELPPAIAAMILHEQPSDRETDLLHEMGEAAADAVLDELDPAEAREIRELRKYGADQAGGLMAKEMLVYPTFATVEEVLVDLRENAEHYANYNVQYAYVTTRRKRLVGVLRMRDLLLARSQRRLEELMIREPVTVSDDTGLEQMAELFDRHAFFGVPVVDPKGRLVGVVQRDAVMNAWAQRAESDYRKAQGIIGGEELRSMPLLLRSRRRLSWLSINIVLNVIAASVIAFYQDVLAQVIALAVFLPIISDMSGCSGNQAVAVSMRELSLGLISSKEHFRVWLKEVSIGMINGFVLGLLVAVGGWIYAGNPWFGVVIGTALMANTILAVSIGGTVPLLLRRFGVDPALASGPILTTITDMCGFFLVLGLASALLHRLT